MNPRIIILIILITISNIITADEISKIENAKMQLTESDFRTFLDTVNVFSDEGIACRSYYDAVSSSELSQTLLLLETLQSLFSPTRYGQKAMLDLAQYNVLQRDYDKAFSLLSPISDSTLCEKNFYLAEVELKRKNYQSSILSAQEFIKCSTDNNKKEQAYLFIAESYINLNQYVRALNTLQYLRNSKLMQNCTPLCLFKIGFAYEMLENYKQAVTEYKSVISKFPYTQYSMQAEERIRNLKNDDVEFVDNSQDTMVIETTKLDTVKTETPTKTNVSTAKELKFYLQAGAFGSNKNAKKLAKRIMSKGYPATVFPKILNGKELKVVAAGPFDQRETAVKAKDKLQTDDIKSFIIKRY
jgi:outer membrane protein assembly factor BamD (BamD/ComL family)